MKSILSTGINADAADCVQTRKFNTTIRIFNDEGKFILFDPTLGAHIYI